MKQLQKIFVRGLVTFLPVALTIYIVYAGINIVDSFLGDPLRQYIPSYIPGLGFLITIFLIFILGALLNSWIAEALFQKLERQLLKVPFIKAVYSPLRDLMNLFSKNGSPGNMQKVVLVDIGTEGQSIRAMGLVTRENFTDVPGIQEKAEDRIAVYVPMSYGLGGFTLLVPRHKITPVDIPVEKAMSLAITGWVKVEKNEGEKS